VTISYSRKLFITLPSECSSYIKVQITIASEKIFIGSMPGSMTKHWRQDTAIGLARKNLEGDSKNTNQVKPNGLRTTTKNFFVSIPLL